MSALTRKLNAFQVILLGFAGVILAGSLLLSLPIATKSGTCVPYLDALFTSTSAVCVTGLVVRDTATYWSVFGKCIILLLIQIGGLGVVTVAVSIAIYSGRKIGLAQRSILQNAMSAPSIGGIVRLAKFILMGTFAVEGAGAVLLLPVFIRDFGVWKGIGYSIFHSISAFCNAGFDLMGVRGQFSSLTTYANNPWVNIVIMALIILGGLGFLTWNDLLRTKFRFRKLSLQSKLILWATGILILVPALYFYFVEFNGQYTGGERVLVSLFQAVTPRTAGFNTADYGSMSDTGLLMTTILMLIGGAPGSTAGGFKVTTFAVLVMSISAAMSGRRNVTIFNKRFAYDCIHDAMALTGAYIFLLLLGAMIISSVEGMPMIRSVFECSSALGTVGLTTGITTSLHTISRLILIGFMYFGRVGCLTLAYGILKSSKKKIGVRPSENVMVG